MLKQIVDMDRIGQRPFLSNATSAKFIGYLPTLGCSTNLFHVNRNLGLWYIYPTCYYNFKTTYNNMMLLGLYEKSPAHLQSMIVSDIIILSMSRTYLF